MWYEISFSQNYYLKPNPVPLQFYDLISIQKAFGLFPSTLTQNNLQWILFWRNRLPPSSEHLLKMQTVIYSETLLPRPQVLPTYTTLCLFTTIKNWSKKHSGWFMEEKLNYSTTLCSEHTVHDVCCCTVQRSELRFVQPVKWNKTVKGYNKTKSCKPFWNTKCYEFYIYRWIYCQHIYPRCNFQNKNEKISQLHERDKL